MQLLQRMTRVGPAPGAMLSMPKLGRPRQPICPCPSTAAARRCLHVGSMLGVSMLKHCFSISVLGLQQQGRAPAYVSKESSQLPPDTVRVVSDAQLSSRQEWAPTQMHMICERPCPANIPLPITVSHACTTKKGILPHLTWSRVMPSCLRSRRRSPAGHSTTPCLSTRSVLRQMGHWTPPEEDGVSSCRATCCQAHVAQVYGLSLALLQMLWDLTECILSARSTMAWGI